MAAGDFSSEILRKQLMVNQMVNAVGCTPEQATTILQRAQWHSDVSPSTPHLPLYAAGPPRLHVYSPPSLSLSTGGAQSLLQRERGGTTGASCSPGPPWPGQELCGDLGWQRSLSGDESGFLCESFPLCVASSLNGSKTPFHSQPKTFSCFSTVSHSPLCARLS